MKQLLTLALLQPSFESKYNVTSLKIVKTILLGSFLFLENETKGCDLLWQTLPAAELQAFITLL